VSSFYKGGENILKTKLPSIATTISEGEKQKSKTVHSNCHIKHTLVCHSVDGATLTLKSLPVLTHGLIAVSVTRTLDKVANLPGSPGFSLGAEARHVSAPEEKVNQGIFVI
jgi:hypothetical protein